MLAEFATQPSPHPVPFVRPFPPATMASGSGKDQDATQDTVYGPLEESTAATAAAAQAVPPPPAPPAEDLHERPGEGGGSLSPDTAAEEEAAAAADRKCEKVATTSPSSPSSPSRYAGSISRPAAPVDSISASEDSSFALEVDSRGEGTVSWKEPLVGEIVAVPKVVRPIDLKNVFDTSLQEQKAIKDPERRLAAAEEQKKGQRKGSKLIFKSALPVLLPPERTRPKPAEEEAAAAADRKGEKVTTPSPSSPSSPSRYTGSISRPTAPVDSIPAGQDSSFALAVDSRREGTVSWKEPLVGEIVAVPKVVRPIDVKNVSGTLLQEQKAIKDPKRLLAAAEEQKKGKHEGTHFHINVSLPIQQLERKVPLPKKVDFKTKKGLPCDPPEGLPQPAPAGPHNGEMNLTVEQYYKDGLSVLDESMSMVKEKKNLVIRDEDTSPAVTKRMARKLGKTEKFLKLAKEWITDFEELEHAQMVDGHAAAVEAEGPAVAGARGLAAAGGGEAPGPVAAGDAGKHSDRLLPGAGEASGTAGDC